MALSTRLHDDIQVDTNHWFVKNKTWTYQKQKKKGTSKNSLDQQKRRERVNCCYWEKERSENSEKTIYDNFALNRHLQSHRASLRSVSSIVPFLDLTFQFKIVKRTQRQCRDVQNPVSLFSIFRLNRKSISEWSEKLAATHPINEMTQFTNENDTIFAWVCGRACICISVGFLLQSMLSQRP